MKYTKKEEKEFKKFLKTIPSKKYQDIDFYKLLRDELISEYKSSQYFDISELYMGHVLDYLRYENNSCCIRLGELAYLRFGSRGKSIDITRVDVNPKYQDEGLGTILMETFLFALLKVKTKNEIEVPDIILECSGQCGHGESLKQTPIGKQVKFFEKFGFRVFKEDDYGYVHLKLSPNAFFEYIQNYSSKNLVKSE